VVTISGSLLKATAIAMNRDESAIAHAVGSRRMPVAAENVRESGDVAQAVASPTGLVNPWYPKPTTRRRWRAMWALLGRA